MKLSEHVEHIRQLIDRAYRNRLGRMGIREGQALPEDAVPVEYLGDRRRMEGMLAVYRQETGSDTEGYGKLVEELTFTLFNRLAAMKVMEAHTLLPEIVTRRESHGGRSFAHLAWLERNPQARQEEAEGLLPFLEERLAELAADIPLFSPAHPCHLLPTALELQGVIQAFNEVEPDPQTDSDLWRSDDILGWLYESYNNFKKAAHKASGEKTEYDKVSIQSQVYTPRWVVQFLVDNSLGKLYLEMYPDSGIRQKYRIAGAPAHRTREPKPLTEIRLIDPATGSGNFLLYAFDLFHDLYLDQVRHYGADHREEDIPRLIVEHNLYGVDLDDRAVQLAQLGLFIKARRTRRTARIGHFHVVSSDFYLPPYREVRDLFHSVQGLDIKMERILSDLWDDLRQAYRFGALIRLEEVLRERLMALVDEFTGPQTSLFADGSLASYEQFRENFFDRLEYAVTTHARTQGGSFLHSKTRDAITFLRLLTQRYDVAVANPPYTDSADFGTELKRFVDANYRQPYKFNSNLYAAFIKRCFELITENGKMALIHPLTFMYISSFIDVRKFMLEKTSIDLFIEFGLGGVFTSKVDVDVCAYVLDKGFRRDVFSFFMNLQEYKGLKIKREIFENSFSDHLSGKSNKHNYAITQEKLKVIEGWPFIYWISDGFREKFKEGLIKNIFKVAEGLTTANNERFLRFWWEIESNDLNEYPFYAKGGHYNKYYGNVWLRINWKNNGLEIKNNSGASVRNERFYFKEGVTFSSVGSKGVNYRVLNSNTLFDSASRSVFALDNENYLLPLAYLNSSLALYTANCLNPTVSTTVGDIERLPYAKPNYKQEKLLIELSKASILLKKGICEYHIIEPNFKQSPLITFQRSSLKDRVLAYLGYENARHIIVLLHEAIINEIIFQVYELSDADRDQVEAKMGKSIGALPVMQEAREAFLAQLQDPLPELLEHAEDLETTAFDVEKVREIREGFAALYQSNNDLEEFCIRHQVNPINVWYWFREAGVLPKARAAEIALEFLADSIRTLLRQDDDGIIPLVGLPGEDALSQRLERHCLEQGFSAAQYVQLEGLLGRPIDDYLEHHFFEDLCNLLNLFRHLPKTPFIWHLSSGPHQGFEAYVLIYTWNRDSLYKLRSHYVGRRVQALEYRQLQLQGVETAQAQNERERIRLQLQEINTFLVRLDELIAEGYDPKLDDGVGKNIAPLQKKGLLRAEVLKSGGRNSQLEKYLNADW